MSEPNEVPYEETELFKMRHSAAHVMAETVLEFFPNAKLAIGPPIRDGFYYDFDLGVDEAGKPITFSPSDIEEIETRMKELLKDEARFEVSTMAVDEALDFFSSQPYKQELIRELATGRVDENGNPVSKPISEVGIYRHRDFVDLCRGPHVDTTASIYPESVKLLRAGGAYWRGSESNPQLQRLYGTAWPSKKELRQHLYRLEEAVRRDHRKLGPQLELFYLDDTAPGMPYWLPAGLKMINTLIDFWRQEHESRGYQEISTPLVNNRRLWEISGHWDHYQDSMFVIPVDEHNTYAVKPMNCPNAMIVYGLKKRSYRDLPLRLSDSDILHRNERSGTLHGLLRVQMFRQDDSHNFVTEDQIEEEIDRILDIADLFYGVFGLEYIPRLSTRPEKYMGDLQSWEKAEASLNRVLANRIGVGKYIVLEGDGAFYGPKIDIMMKDALDRSWQMGTIQLDFQLPKRFNLTYTDSDGEEKTPVVIHRVIYGSLERFMGILIEHFAGAFPFWISPTQIVVIPIADRHIPYATKVSRELKSVGLRSEVDDRNERLNAKIRDAQLRKTPLMAIVGDREQEGHTVSVRVRSGEDLGATSIDRLIDACLEQVAKKRVEPIQGF